MSSEPAAFPRSSRQPASRREDKGDDAQAKKAKVTEELRAMMRDVPVSDRLKRVLDDLEAHREQDGSDPADGDARKGD